MNNTRWIPATAAGAILLAVLLWGWKGDDIKAFINPPNCPLMAYPSGRVAGAELQRLKSTTTDETPKVIIEDIPSMKAGWTAILGTDGSLYRRSIWIVDLVNNRWKQLTSGVEFNDQAVVMLESGTIIAIRQEFAAGPSAGNLYAFKPDAYRGAINWDDGGYRFPDGKNFVGFELKENGLNILAWDGGTNANLWTLDINPSTKVWNLKNEGRCE